MGTGADQARWLRKRLTFARGKRGEPGYITQKEVASRVAEVLRDSPTWKRRKKKTLTKQAISLWEKDEVQPGVDELAAWTRAVNLRLWVDVYDPLDRTVEARVRIDLLRLIKELELLPATKLDLVKRMVRELRTELPDEEVEADTED